ncbi:hypothetical protein K402DRAFT_418204 [Aulographum hederae CBS 113979]|uniref:Xylanolytic transcriptional activator regulatory domain-containing protein n=1 Tax=Aulographum hederae CBS 113979 TaxID=1176131 RepID=A0A6G1HB01_9PEZI|nr:hypothetical protein K402DRAFT_418204 [Aulographum hederae CBS 113979]
MTAKFFTTTHQRIPALSKHRFYADLQSSTPGPPQPDFAALYQCIVLVQQVPSKATGVKSPLYIAVKNLIGSIEITERLSLNLLHCKILIAFYEIGHGLQTAAYTSIAACARIARVLGLHRKRWRKSAPECELVDLEEEKRMWWAIVIMDRFIGLCNGDALFVTDDPERTDPLPIEDLLWSEASTVADLEAPIMQSPLLNSPLGTAVGQMARESQISHLVGRVVRHLFDPTPDLHFNAEEAVQLERTLKAYLPLLAKEELSIGKYCAAFAMCNSSLYILYEFQLRQGNRTADERHRILQSMEETAVGALTFAEATYGDREENYPWEIMSPYLAYSLCQTAIVQYRLSKHSSDPIHIKRLHSLRWILNEIAKRWKMAGKLF